MRILICILTYNRLPSLQALLSPLFFAAKRQPWDVIILDQGSTDGTAQWVEENINCIVTRARSNWGCAGGRQRIVDRNLYRMRDEDIFVFLDDDIVCTADTWLDNLIAPIIRGEYDITGIEGKRVQIDGMTYDDHDYPHYVSGGWCAISAKVFRAGVEFDLRYNPTYYEDVDLCWQASTAGFRIGAVDNVGLLHNHPANSKPNMEQVERSRAAFLAKWRVQPTTTP